MDHVHVVVVQKRTHMQSGNTRLLDRWVKIYTKLSMIYLSCRLEFHLFFFWAIFLGQWSKFYVSPKICNGCDPKLKVHWALSICMHVKTYEPIMLRSLDLPACNDAFPCDIQTKKLT